MQSDCNDEHSANAAPPNAVTELPRSNVTVESPLHFSKHLAGIVGIDERIRIDRNELQPRNKSGMKAERCELLSNTTWTRWFQEWKQW
jgi:hypothetical protein